MQTFFLGQLIKKDISENELSIECREHVYRQCSGTLELRPPVENVIFALMEKLLILLDYIKICSYCILLLYTHNFFSALFVACVCGYKLYMVFFMLINRGNTHPNDIAH